MYVFVLFILIKFIPFRLAVLCVCVCLSLRRTNPVQSQDTFYGYFERVGGKEKRSLICWLSPTRAVPSPKHKQMRRKKYITKQDHLQRFFSFLHSLTFLRRFFFCSLCLIHTHTVVRFGSFSFRFLSVSLPLCVCRFYVSLRCSA